MAAVELLPGFRRDLLDAGAIEFDTADLAWLGEQGWTWRDARTFHVFSTTRPQLELTLRRRVALLPLVQIRDRAQVVALHRREARWVVELSDGSDVESEW